MLKKDHFYFKSWIFLVSSESFINKRMSLALTSWAHICRRTCFSSATGYSRNEKSDLLLKRKKNKSLPSALLWSITWRETYLDMFAGQWLHLAAKKISWVAASWSMKSVMVAVMFSLFCVQNLQSYCTGSGMSGEYELWPQEFAVLEELHGPTQCMQENRISLDKCLTVWDSLQLTSLLHLFPASL